MSDFSIGDQVAINSINWLEFLADERKNDYPIVTVGVVEKIGTNRGDNRIKVRFPNGDFLCFDPKEIKHCSSEYVGSLIAQNLWSMKGLVKDGLFADMTDDGDPIAHPIILYLNDLGDKATMANVYAAVGIFPSASQARKNGFNDSIQLDHVYELTKKKIRVKVLKERPVSEEQQINEDGKAFNGNYWVAIGVPVISIIAMLWIVYYVVTS
jgi:hypothetical protein